MLEKRNQRSEFSLNKSCLIWLLCFNVGATIALYISFHIAIGAGKLIILSNYREWDLNGVISQEGIDTFKDGQFSGDWAKLPTDLYLTAFRRVEYAAFATVILFLINSGMLCFVYFRNSRRTWGEEKVGKNGCQGSEKGERESFS